MKTLLFLLFDLALHAESLITLNVEPSKEHPRNSEGSFATLASGRSASSSKAIPTASTITPPSTSSATAPVTAKLAH